MQYFRIRKDARDWFRDLKDKEKTFKIDFDAFYFCFMAGVAKRRKKSMPPDDTPELIPYFPEKYNGRVLVALFLSAELKQLGVALTEKHAVHSAIARFVDQSASHHLSDEGVREFNKYAFGGYEVLIDWFDGDRPRTTETFLRTFKRHLDAALLNDVS